MGSARLGTRALLALTLLQAAEAAAPRRWLGDLRWGADEADASYQHLAGELPGALVNLTDVQNDWALCSVAKGLVAGGAAVLLLCCCCCVLAQGLAGLVLSRGRAWLSQAVGDGSLRGEAGQRPTAQAGAGAEARPRLPEEVLAGAARQNRERFEEHQRQVLIDVVWRSLPLIFLFFSVILLFVVLGVCFYIWGWVIWLEHRKETCDVALQNWLVVILSLTLVRILLLSASEGSDGWLRQLLDVTNFAMLGVGLWLLLESETCRKTSPALYCYVQAYLVFFFVTQLLACSFVAGMVGVVLWMHRRGLLDRLLDDGPGPHMAARKDLVQELETVDCDPELFGEQPDECCICQEAFTSSPQKVIKRAPCGHIFHEECLGEWLGMARTCPLCRGDLQEAMDATSEPAPIAP